MEHNKEACESKCGCACHSAMGVLVIAFGLTFLLSAMGVISQDKAGIAWPIIVILAGLKKTFGGMCKCCKKA